MIKTELAYCSIQELLDEKIILEMQDGNHGERHPRQSDFVSEGIPFLTATNVIDEQVLIHLAPRVSHQKAKTLRIGWIQPDDILLAHNATVGRVGIVPKFEGKAVIGTSLTYYRLNQQRLNSNFFALVLRSQDFQAQLEQAMEQTTRNQVPITRQKELSVPLPPIAEQKRIATIAQKADRLRRSAVSNRSSSACPLKTGELSYPDDLSVSNSSLPNKSTGKICGVVQDLLLTEFITHFDSRIIKKFFT
ncbi:MAG TPA: restriction endonuclease subunit S [Coleofasciculaceae cyanobacterium]|jgi:type I restriction enzyme S subunit